MKDREHSREDADQRDKADFKAAMSRLEKAVQEVVNVTTEELSDRATNLIDDTSKRLEAELRLRRVETESPDVEQSSARRRQRRHNRHRFSDRRNRFARRTARLYKDPADEKIAGVCAALARYFGMETWIVRMGALTGLIFLPGIVFPAYWILYFIMDKKPVNRQSSEPGDGEDAPNSSSVSSSLSRRERKRQKRQERREARDDDRNSARGNTPEFTPSRSMRHTINDMTQAELRLRRLESFVTSDRYELQKELHKIEREGSTA